MKAYQTAMCKHFRFANQIAYSALDSGRSFAHRVVTSDQILCLPFKSPLNTNDMIDDF